MEGLAEPAAAQAPVVLTNVGTLRSPNCLDASSVALGRGNLADLVPGSAHRLGRLSARCSYGRTGLLAHQGNDLFALGCEQVPSLTSRRNGDQTHDRNGEDDTHEHSQYQDNHGSSLRPDPVNDEMALRSL